MEYLFRGADFALRPFTLSDAPVLAKHANNPDIAKNLRDAFPFPYTERDAREFLSHVVRATPTNVFCIEAGGEPSGSIGVFVQSDIYRKSAEIGYWLAEHLWGREIMTRAAALVADYAFKTWPIERIYAGVFESNLASERVLQKAGFTFEARHKNAIYKNGRLMDEIVLSLLRQATNE